MNDRSGRRGRSVPEALDRGLVAYAVAAAAGLTAAPELAEGSIVYTDPVDVTISNDGESIDLDLDGGTSDARLSILESFIGGGGYGQVDATLEIESTGPTSVVGSPDVVTAGTSIGPASTLASIQGNPLEMAHVYIDYSSEEGIQYYGTSGPWAPSVTDGYLGLQILINGTSYFGWARLDVDTISGYSPQAGEYFARVSATLKDFAFENCPGEAILAGATEGGATCTTTEVPGPSPLGLLALGAAGLALWRRRQA